jgi:hypothetical protein
MDQRWLADGSAVLVIDAGQGEPADEDYRPALVARLATEYHEPAQVLDADPLGAGDDGPALVPGRGASAAGTVTMGELRGVPQPSPAPKPTAAGPNTPDVTTRQTAAEDPNVTAPGSPAAVGALSPVQLGAAIRDLVARADAGDADAQGALEDLSAELDELGTATAGDTAAAPAVATDQTLGPDRTQADTPETGADGTTADGVSTTSGGPASGVGADAPPAGATGAGAAPAV